MGTEQTREDIVSQINKKCVGNENWLTVSIQLIIIM